MRRTLEVLQAGRLREEGAEGPVDGVRQAEDVPACVAGRDLEQVHVEALKHVSIGVARRCCAQRGLERARQVVLEQLARRLLQVVPAMSRGKVAATPW